MAVKHEMLELSPSGDVKHIWDPNTPAEVENAKKTFNEFVKDKKYAAFKVEEGGGKGEQVRTFDPQAGRMILVPPMQGG